MSMTASDRLGMVYEARGDHRKAAGYYRKVITVIRNHPDNYDPAFEAVFQKLIDRLEPKADDDADYLAGPTSAPASPGARRRQGIHALGAEPPHPRLRSRRSRTQVGAEEWSVSLTKE